MSHLHKDHAGGIYKNDEMLKQKFLSFSNAAYYIHKDEMEFALKKGPPSYRPTDFDLLQNSDQVVFLEGDGVIDNYITYKVSGGTQSLPPGFLD